MSSQEQKVKVGVIGAGALGKHHVRLYSGCPQAELIGVYDPDPDAVAAIADEVDVQTYAAMHDLLDDVDGVSVAVPTNLHYDIVKEVLLNDRHVLVEKPITDDVGQAEELVELAVERGLVLNVGHVERYNPVLSSLDDVEGEPRFIEGHRLAPYPPARPGKHPRGTEVSVVLDLMIHDLDVVLELVQSPVKRLEAVGVPILSATSDLANARIVFENQCVANLTSSRVSADKMRKVRVFKPNAYLSLDYGNLCGDIAYQEGGEIKRHSVPVHETNALEAELKEFCDCVSNAKVAGELRECKTSGEKGLAALRLAQQVMDSMDNVAG